MDRSLDDEAEIREHLEGIGAIVAGAGTIEGRRLVRKVRAWAEETESGLFKDRSTDVDMPDRRNTNLV